jgi:membrane-bound ClpP family serine protease
MLEVDQYIRLSLAPILSQLEAHFGADVIFFYGPICPTIEKIFREFIEKLKQDGAPKDRLAVFLNTPGGSAETVEKLVEIIRYHYKEVYFVVPDEAMSAGTVFCMSGDKIYMDYSSSLGPVDPQVYNGKDWVPALGYLDQVEKMIAKSASNTITTAELIILQNQDLAMLSRYEQAKNLTITLLKKWLVEYKFKDWTTHRTTASKLNKPVTLQEKEERAEQIAKDHSNNKEWHSHGRNISAATLSTKLRLKIEDYSLDPILRPLIRAYSDLLTDYIQKNEHQSFMHHRCYF